MCASEAFRTDSYCGLYCGACEVLTLYRESLEQGKPAQWENLPRALKEVIPPSPIRCTGCKTDLLSPGCQKCAIRACARSKSVEACVLCQDYPCQLVCERKASISENLEDILPHIRVKFSQAEHIRKIGYRAWSEEQGRRWRCPDCGTPFTWYQENCKKCGFALAGHKEHDSEPHDCT